MGAVEQLDLNQAFKNCTVLITGCSGFVGRNVILALTDLNVFKKGLLKIICASRKCSASLSHLSRTNNIELIDWDISHPFNNILPDIDYVFHLAGVIGRSDAITEDTRNYEVNVLGTLNLLSAITGSKNPKILFASSGAVYDYELIGRTSVKESSPTGIEFEGVPKSYQQSKIQAEKILLDVHSVGSAEVVIARLFTFIGPYMAYNSHYAVANFLRDCLKGQPIRISGDGNSVRSYQHSVDMGHWLIRILLLAESGSIYNVGSDEPVSIKELAEMVYRICENTNGIETMFSSQDKTTFYLPNTQKARSELGLTNEIELSRAILKTYKNLKRTIGS